jgi:endonuclease/exonuclease/phosphatase family metal-dependent hydrolase
MRGPSRRRLWQAVAVGACVVVAITSLAGATAAGPVPRSSADPERGTLRILQLNLCNSGIANCYTGRSLGLAVDLVRQQRPDLVTLNEVCRDDVTVVRRAMTRAGGEAEVASAFAPAVDRGTGGAVRCRTGQPYGIGLVARVPSSESTRTYRGRYPMQDASDPEERVWLCLHAPTDRYACTTHLASRSPAVALAQCRYLMRTALPDMRDRGGADPVVLGGDLNLVSGGTPDARACVPRAYPHADDGARQHVVTSPDYTVRGRRSIDMQGTTDHPGLLVDLGTA